MDGWNTSWMVGILVSFWDGLFSGAMLVSGRVYIHLHTVYLWVWIDSHNLVTHDTPTILGWVQCDEDITLHASARLELVDPIGDHSRCTREVQPIPCAPTRLLLWHKLGILILVDVTTGLEVFCRKTHTQQKKVEKKWHVACSYYQTSENLCGCRRHWKSTWTCLWCPWTCFRHWMHPVCKKKTDPFFCLEESGDAYRKRKCKLN